MNPFSLPVLPLCSRLAAIALAGLVAAPSCIVPEAMALEAGEPAATTPEAGAPDTAPRRLWTCGMHPQVVQDHPGDCPICHMELTPVAAASGAASAGSVRIDPAMMQNMGLRTAEVRRGPLVREVRAAGMVVEAVPLVHDVSLRVDAWITRLHAHTDGMPVAVGEPLFEAYSPALVEAAEELVSLRGGGEAAAALRPAVERRLARLGLDAAEIRRLAALDSAPSSFVFRSPVAGEITERSIVEGSAVTAGQKVLRIADHSRVWVEARVPARDLPLLAPGQAVRVQAEGSPAPVHGGEVMLVLPHVDEATRTAMVRVALANPGFALRPGMFATVTFEVRAGDEVLTVAREAVIDTGERRLVFVALEEAGRFEPREVTTGHAGAGGIVEVREGLGEGERVVVSGQFLLDAESRVQEALQRFLAEGGDAPSGPAPAGHRH